MLENYKHELRVLTLTAYYSFKRRFLSGYLVGREATIEDVRKIKVRGPLNQDNLWDVALRDYVKRRVDKRFARLLRDVRHQPTLEEMSTIVE